MSDEELALAMRATYAARTCYDFCTHGDYPATCVTCLENARIAVANNSVEWIMERIL